MRVQQIEENPLTFGLYKERQQVGGCVCEQGSGPVAIIQLLVAEAWRGRGYGSFLLKEVLKATGGYAGASLHTAPEPQTPAARALLAKFGFTPAEGHWARLRRPDPTAVSLTHGFLQNALQPGGFFIDATCGNGGDTEFLCRLAGPDGRVLALDVQAEAVQNTNRRLAQAGLEAVGHAVQADHAQLAQLAGPATADCVVFNFGYLPGANHNLVTTPQSSLPALDAALNLLKPGGVLAACLYSGGPNGQGERQALLEFFSQLPIARYTVLVCQFANWATTAPLPCFVLKKETALE